MTHPSRDMIAQIVRNGMNRLAASQAGARPVVSASKEADRVASEILAALASGSGDHSGGVTDMIGSGDHAELADQAKRDIEWSCLTTVRPSVLLEILAENAALRAANTEAERKLAEAAGLLSRIAFTPEGQSGLSLDECVSAARTFLSKEAGRG